METNSDAETVRTLLKHVAEEWRDVRAERRGQPESAQWPVAAWIRLHDPLPPDADEPMTPLRRAWYLDEDGMREKDPWQFARYWSVHYVRPWAAPGWPLKDTAFGMNRYRISYASFAEYENSDECYLETTWGGLWARGRRVQVAGGVVRDVRVLWVA